ncbi:MAG: 4-(cytidine 5'-diphospho)-2-C-methyl-D-erythritol kinase [Desulfovibrio sp.]|nr:4-(cytidine 5'-diphospho)-2-C-methyl-D-erythritol kinase [Desulfovibrio sp.]
MNTETILAGCKVNLGLRITGVRADGYHELDSLFYPLDEPHDQLEITPASQPGITVHCDATGIDPVNNTLTKVYAAFVDAAGHAPAITVVLRKGIPSGAGLGGGSSDAAALLLWLDSNVKSLDRSTLIKAALCAGADTPFFLQKSACRVQGIGEILSPSIKNFSGFWLVLACPDIHVSTSWAYAAYDAAFSGQIDLTKRPCKVNGTICSNDLEAVVFARYPLLARIKSRMSHYGTYAACMSGSGSSIAGLFTPADEIMANNAAIALRKNKLRVIIAQL